MQSIYKTFFVIFNSFLAQNRSQELTCVYLLCMHTLPYLTWLIQLAWFLKFNVNRLRFIDYRPFPVQSIFMLDYCDFFWMKIFNRFLLMSDFKIWNFTALTYEVWTFCWFFQKFWTIFNKFVIHENLRGSPFPKSWTSFMNFLTIKSKIKSSIQPIIDQSSHITYLNDIETKYSKIYFILKQKFHQLSYQRISI